MSNHDWIKGERAAIGIDPGKTGAFALILEDRVILRKMPDHPYKIFELLCEWMGDWDCRGILEQVQGFSRDHYGGRKCPVCKNSLKKVGAKSQFTFGQMFGHVEALAHAAYLPHVLSPAASWERAAGIYGKGGEYSSKKRFHATWAKEKFPDVKGLTQQTADALLLADLAADVWLSLPDRRALSCVWHTAEFRRVEDREEASCQKKETQ